MSAWRSEWDEHSQQYYYVHDLTNETTWEQPAGYTSNPQPQSPTSAHQITAGGASQWQEMIDESGNVYYYNTVTQESSWENPFKSQPEINPAKSLENPFKKMASKSKPEISTAQTPQKVISQKTRAEPTVKSAMKQTPKASSTTNPLASASSGASTPAAKKVQVVQAQTPATPPTIPKFLLSKSSLRGSVAVASPTSKATEKMSSLMSPSPQSKAGTPTVSVAMSHAQRHQSVIQSSTAKPVQIKLAFAHTAAEQKSATSSTSMGVKTDEKKEGGGGGGEATSTTLVGGGDDMDGDGEDTSKQDLAAELSTLNADTPIADVVRLIGSAGITIEQFGEKHFHFERRGIFQNKSTTERILSWKVRTI